MAAEDGTTDSRWRRLNDLFHDATDRAPHERARFLDHACSDDPTLRAEVERLLSAYERSTELERPAIAAVVDGLPAPASLAALGAMITASQLSGMWVGPYRIVQEVGRGGMGVVYVAERADGLFEQRVAVKLIKRGMDSDLVLQRFLVERRIIASLEHPNIARLLDGGTTNDGQPYVVMEYVDGLTIDRYVKAHDLSIVERLRLFLRVCVAVAYAHRHRVVHRDIKPSNILVTAEGEPKLLDFGIAKVLEAAPGDPTTGTTEPRFLTPDYASPEQVAGRTATPASDVYSLGVVLYELLAGCSPYQLTSRDPLSVAEAVRTSDPERPSAASGRGMVDQSRRNEVRRSLRGDLDTIVLMALRKEPARRYQHVEQLADDIERHLAGLPISARAEMPFYRMAKFVRRNRATVVSATAAGIVALVIGAELASPHSSGKSDLTSGSSVLARRDRVLVADFADRAADPSLAAALTEAFRVDLTQSPAVQVLSARQVRSTLMQMERSPDLALDDSLAREVAMRDGVKAFVTGTVSHIAGRYLINAQLLSAQKGEVLAAEREIAADSLDLIRALDRISGRLRARMGESMRSVQATPPLEQVTTRSLAALRAYTDGTRANQSGDRQRALELMQRAVAIDTGFASAYRAMTLIYGDRLESGRAAAMMEHAFANQARLPFLERNLMLAARASGPLGDDDAAISAYHRILERYPDDVRALNNLAFLLSFRRQFAAQESLLVRAISIDSTILALYTQLAMAQVNRGDFDAARSTLDRVERRSPEFFNAKLAEIYLASARQDWATAERHARARLMIHPADTGEALGGVRVLSQILMSQGRVSEAEDHLRRELALSAASGDRGDHVTAATVLGMLQLRYRSAPNEALRTVDAALARFPLDSIPETDRPWNELARFYAAVGRPTRAREFLLSAMRSPAGRRPSVRASRHWSLGVVALAEHRSLEAVSELRIAADSLDCPICALPDLARSFEAIGQTDSATATYERYLREPWEWRFETDDLELGYTLAHLGALYGQRGDCAKADSLQERLVRLWHTADAAVSATRDRPRQCAGRTPA